MDYELNLDNKFLTFLTLEHTEMWLVDYAVDFVEREGCNVFPSVFLFTTSVAISK